MSNTSSSPPQPIGASAPDISQTMNPTTGGTPPTNPGVSGLTFDQVENYWIQAGGNPQAAAMAAAVADAESGLNPSATRTNPDGTTSIGLFLIPQNGTPPGTTDPLANARAAVQLSQNGTDWTQWCSTWSDNNCGENGGTYLGSGSNALMSLGTQASGGQYNVFGSTPSSNGVGASTATSSAPGGTTSSSSSSLLIIIVIVAIVVVVYYWNKRRGGGTTTVETETEPE